MCGFAGFLAPPQTWPGRDQAQRIAIAMRDMVAHRGPDDRGLWLDDPAGLAFGFRRLSIIDLSEHGHQPMISACGRYVMVFNGEIYNHEHLRRNAESWGHVQWRGHSDSETVLAHVSHHGVVKTLEFLNGMFAIAIWDRRERNLWLARDRFGEKPLYYGKCGDHFVFASELKALRAHPFHTNSVNRQAVGEFLRHGFITDPLTIYDGAWKLPPGHLLLLEWQKEPKIWPYWDAVSELAAARADPFKGGMEDAVAELERKIRSVTAARMVADVPLGAFLSGGIDSSTVVAAMMASGHDPVKTYTVGFPGTPFDEAPHAEAVARHLGGRHTTFRIGESDLTAIVPEMGKFYDEPFADPSQIPTVVLCREARRQVTVALAGDGGDEMFCGYSRYIDVQKQWKRVHKYPELFRRISADIVQSIRGMDTYPFRHIRKKLAKIGSPNIDALYRNAMSRWRPDEGLADPVTGIATEWDRTAPKTGADFSVTRSLMLRDILTYLPADLLVKVDRASMAFGLEVRAPLLDHEMAAFIWSMPDSFLMEGGGKALLRKVLARHVPPSLFERPKQGFEPPLTDWLRGDLREWAGDLLGGHSDYYDVRIVRRRWNEHVSGRRKWTYPLWTVLMLESWLDHNSRAPTLRDSAIINTR